MLIGEAFGRKQGREEGGGLFPRSTRASQYLHHQHFAKDAKTYVWLPYYARRVLAALMDGQLHHVFWAKTPALSAKNYLTVR